MATTLSVCHNLENSIFNIYVIIDLKVQQVFLIILVWMIAAFKHYSREERKNVIISYDNMSHLNSLKVAQQPLPLPGDLQYLWLDVIDSTFEES